MRRDRLDFAALGASASLASDHLRLFGLRFEGGTPTLAPKQSMNWDMEELDILGWKLHTRTGRVSLLPSANLDVTAVLPDAWPNVVVSATAREVSSLTTDKFVEHSLRS